VLTLSLPLADSPSARRRRSAIPRTLEGNQVAVVDDEPVVLRSLVTGLERIGATVRTFDGGRALLDALEQGAPFDAIVTDLGMPGIDGRALAVPVASMRPSLPVALLTGWGEQVDARGDGLRAVLSKPATVDDVRRCLEGLLLG
jgi:CheY-like chemotaxis protein